MKIQTDIQSITEKRTQPLKGINETSSAFKGMMNRKQGQLQNDKLTELLNKIDQQGQRLVSSQTVRDLQQYKKLIHQFVNETVSYGMGLKQTRNWFQHGGQKMTIIKKVDDHLVELTDHLLGKEQDSMKLLQQIGELKGLLINLYL